MNDDDPRVGVRPHRCPTCNSTLDAATNVYGAGRPEPGDVTICFYCGSLMLFDDELGVREPTDGERERLLANPQVTRAMAAVVLQKARP